MTLFEPPIIRPSRERCSRVVLALLLAADAALIVLFVLQGFHLIADDGLQITRDRSYGEVFQYIKLFWISLLLAALAWRNRWWFSAGMAGIFLYFMADDYAELHEACGNAIASLQSRETLWGIDVCHYGELVTFVLYAMVLILLVMVLNPARHDGERLLARDLLRLLVLAAVFAVGFDALHVLPWPEFVGDVMGTIEDGGEMVAASLILWRVFDELVGQLHQPAACAMPA